MDVDDDEGDTTWDYQETWNYENNNKVEFAALTDVPKRYVEIWRLSSKGKGGREKLDVVAHLGIDDGGCCANVVWLD